METRELWHTDSGTSEFRSVQVNPSEGSTLLSSLYSFISQGTERIVAMGKAAGMPSEMQVPYMKGSLALPCTYGYSLVGKVEESNSLKRGTVVHVMHPHQPLVTVRDSDIAIVPEGIPARRAALKSNMETVVNAVWDGRPELGDRILIVGGGNIGQLLALTLNRFPALEIDISEKDQHRREKLEGLGFSTAASGGDYDLVFHCSASEEGLKQAVNAVRKEGTMVEMSWYGTRQINVPLGGSFHFDRKKIISSQVSSIPVHKYAWNYARRTSLVWKLLRDDRYDAVIDEVIDYADSVKFFSDLRTGKNLPSGVLFHYQKT